MRHWRRSRLRKRAVRLPPGSLEKQCISCRAIDLQEYKVRHSSLDVQQDYTHHKTQLRSCSRPPSRRKWHMLNPPMALPNPAWASSLSVCKVQVQNPGNVCVTRAHQVKPILFQTVHNDLESLAGHPVPLFLLAFGVHTVKPLHIYSKCL